MEIMINQYLLDYIGKTRTQNVLDDITNIVLENKIKKLGYNPRPNVVSIVHTEKNKEILGLGASIPSDLVSDNLLTILTGFFSTPTQANRLIQMKNISDVLKDFHVVSSFVSGSDAGFTSMWNSTVGGVNCGIQIGSGLAQATRQDISIENPFSNGGAEDNRNTISLPVYNAVLFRNSFGIGFNSTGAGGITETVLQNRFMTNLTGGRTVQTIQLSRDNIDPVVSFITGQSIFVEYVFQY